MREKIFVGTSGWYYGWNPKKNFDWFRENSGLNAVELNASFYRFPFPNQVKSWAKKGKKFHWSIKVNRLITHVFKFSERSLSTWKKFQKLFSPLDESIDFYLFQLPPDYTPKAVSELEKFIEKTGLRKRFALEVRNIKWYDENWIDWVKDLGITWVSVDSPDFPLDIYNTSGLIYERLHGRYAWYSHDYIDKELKDIARRIKEKKPQAVYAFFNNNTNMLKNAQRALEILKGL